MNSNKRNFLKRLGISTAGTLVLGATPLFSACAEKFAGTTPAVHTIADSDFKISLTQWALHRSFLGDSIAKGWGVFAEVLQVNPDSLYIGSLHPDNFPAIAADTFGIHNIELVNTFYYGKAGNPAYWDAFKTRCDQLDVSVGLILCDVLGNIGDAGEAKRIEAVEKHQPWVDVAAKLGARAIRVNAAGSGDAQVAAANAVDGLQRLLAYAQPRGVDVIVENHGGYSSDGQWVSGVIKTVGNPHCGTLADFGNFCIERTATSCARGYDRYKGMTEIMPYAKGVSAKSYGFDATGNETRIDFMRMMSIVKKSGYRGYVGIEYEGSELSEEAGINATHALLNKCFAAI